LPARSAIDAHEQMHLFPNLYWTEIVPFQTSINHAQQILSQGTYLGRPLTADEIEHLNDVIEYSRAQIAYIKAKEQEARLKTRHREGIDHSNRNVISRVTQ